MPAQTPGQKRLRDQLGAAIERSDWQGLQQVITAYANAALQPPTHEARPVELPVPPPLQALPEDLTQQLARRFEAFFALLNTQEAKTRQLHQQLMEQLQAPPVDAKALARRLHDQHYQLSFSIADQLQVLQLVQELLQTLIQHLAQDPTHGSWLVPQLTAIEQAITPPLSPAPLVDARRELQTVIHRRMQLQDGMAAAQQALRTCWAASSSIWQRSRAATKHWAPAWRKPRASWTASSAWRMPPRCCNRCWRPPAPWPPAAAWPRKSCNRCAAMSMPARRA